MQANPSAGTFGSYAAPATYGRPKRGTPAYAAAVRRQIAQLAALHAASVASAPAEVAAVRTVMLVTACKRFRESVRLALGDLVSVRLHLPSTPEMARALLSAGPSQLSPDLLLVDQAAQALLAEAPTARAVLIADVVPRSSDLPPGLVGVMARSSSAERVGRQLHELLALFDAQS